MADDDRKEGLPRSEASTSAYPLSRLSARHDLVDVAREIQAADATLGTVTVAKLRVIAEQIRALQAQAARVLDEAKHAGELHRAACSFKRRAGHVYHLYRKQADASLYWSMLSPEEWGTPPDEFQGSFRLENDMTWTPVDQAEQRDTIEEPLRKLLR
ncbi:MAG: DUF2452 domain-containing protein [Deltaproteobacteria bacterium]|nr:DUF2452 domain-containing protein [Deltaproteobacteria bacterium]